MRGLPTLIAVATVLIILGSPFVALVWFLRIFLIEVNAESCDEATAMALHTMIRYCYLLMFSSFIIVLMPFLIIACLPEGIIGTLYSVMLSSPVSLVSGCVEDSDPTHPMNELVCRPEAIHHNWIINIGGSVGVTQPPSLGAAPQSSSAVPALLGQVFLPSVVVNGGVTVPLYFILVALLGASIGMARRIPEYQAQLAMGSRKPPEVRMDLAIQVLQLVTAPFLAIVAYAFLEPTGRGAIGLAFITGFSSQTILAILISATSKLEIPYPKDKGVAAP